MRKETRTEERVVKSNYTVYIADDGKEFDNERECEAYERNGKLDILQKAFDDMRINEYDDILPINADEWPEKSCWWFNLKSKEEYDLIINYYSTLDLAVDYMSEPDAYPALVCIIETDEYVETMYLDDIIKSTKQFFDMIDINVNFERR